MLKTRPAEQSIAGADNDFGHDALGQYKLHPKYILRIAGESCAFIEDLPAGRASQVCDDLDLLLRSVEPQAKALTDALGALVPGEKDRAVSNALLALRRDLFNLRASRASTLDLAQPALSPDLTTRLAAITGMLRQAAAMRASVSACYKADDEGVRAALPALFQHVNVNDGLQSSNPALWRKLTRFYVDGDRSLRAKDRQSLDLTFYSYYLRTALKTSPHASFGPFVVGAFRPSILQDKAVTFAGRQMKRLVNIRHIAIADILRPLLRDIDNLAAFPFTVNETLRAAGGKVTLRCLIDPADPSAYVRNHQAAVITLNANRPLDAIIALYRGREAGASIPLGDIEQAVLDALPANLHRASRKAVQALITANVLEPDTGYDEFADPFIWADQTLARMPGEKANAARTCLTAARRALNDYASGPRARRAEAIDRLRSQLDEAQHASGAGTSADVFDRVLHEDCRLTGDAELSAAALDPLQPDLQCLVSLMPILERVARLQYWITDEFVAAFGLHGVCDNPEQFFTTIAQRLDRLFDGADNQLAGYQALSSEIARSGIAGALDTLHERLLAHIEQAVAAAAPVARLDRHVLMALAAATPTPVRNCAISQCFFGQFLNPRRQGARFVVNHIYSGNGKMMSRFLDPDDPDLDRVRAYLEDNCRDGRIAEIPGLYGFNANIHPRLFDTEILVPPFTRRRRGVRQYLLRALTLRVHQATRRLQLVAPDGRGLEAFFLGAMATPVLPPVIRMLDGLYAYGGPAFDLPLMLARRTATPDGLIDVPRIQLGEVILSRRTIFVPRAALPQSGQEDEAFFVAMQAWRRQFALPRKMFVKFPPSWFQPHVETTSDGRARGKWKPLPMDFTSPMSVRLFRKALSGSAVGAVFSEAAPDFEDHDVWIDGKRYASELQFEITRRPFGEA